MKIGKATAFYVVWVGKTPGIYYNWPTCQEQVIGFKGAKFKRFETLADAEEAFEVGTEKALKQLELVFTTPQAVYTDGGLVSANPSSIGGTWAWALVEETDAKPQYDGNAELGGLDSTYELVKSASGFLPAVDSYMTNNITEYYAVLAALEALPDFWTGRLLTDSQNAIQRFEGCKITNVPQEYIDRMNRAKKRLGKITPIHVDGHPSQKQLKAGIGKRGNHVSKWNVYCDDLCNIESDKHKL